MSFTIFSNFRINSEENFIRMKDSYNSFKNADIKEWIINFRGSYKLEAMKFLEDELGEKLTKFELNSNKGWFYDTKKIYNYISTDYLLYWIEDHYCICDSNKLNSVVSEMKKNNLDYLGYSWFGLGTFLDEFKDINKNDSTNIQFFKYNHNSNNLRQKHSFSISGHESNIISLAGIFSREMFRKILFCRRPYLRRWPKETPFDFEKKSRDTYILPIIYGIPKYELFSNIDDDNLILGSSLISRNMYPKRIIREKLIADREDFKTTDRFILLKKYINKIPLGIKALHFLKRLSYHL